MSYHLVPSTLLDSGKYPPHKDHGQVMAAPYLHVCNSISSVFWSDRCICRLRIAIRKRKISTFMEWILLSPTYSNSLPSLYFYTHLLCPPPLSFHSPFPSLSLSPTAPPSIHPPSIPTHSSFASSPL